MHSLSAVVVRRSGLAHIRRAHPILGRPIRTGRNFAYRIAPGVGTYASVGALALVLAVLTVTYQALRAALANPVETLRCE